MCFLRSNRFSVHSVAQWKAALGQDQAASPSAATKKAAGKFQPHHSCSFCSAQSAGHQAQQPMAQLQAFALQWINQQSAKGPRVPHRVFCVSARLYLFNSDLSAFLPLDDMPSNMPQQIWSAVQDLAEIDAGMANPHTSLQFCQFVHAPKRCLVMCMIHHLTACWLCKFA